MKLWLTPCRGGRGLLTFIPPVIARIKGSPHEDAFEQVGEPIAIKHLCEDGMQSALKEHGQVLGPPLQPRRVEMTLRYID